LVEDGLSSYGWLLLLLPSFGCLPSFGWWLLLLLPLVGCCCLPLFGCCCCFPWLVVVASFLWLLLGWDRLGEIAAGFG
jgi:hypothetical protein